MPISRVVILCGVQRNRQKAHSIIYQVNEWLNLTETTNNKNKRRNVDNLTSIHVKIYAHIYRCIFAHMKIDTGRPMYMYT